MRSARKPKYTPGEVITSPGDLILAASIGRWIYKAYGAAPSQTRPYHPSWIINQNFACIMWAISKGQLRLAVRNPDYPYLFIARRYEHDKPEVYAEWWVTSSEFPKFTEVCYTKESVRAACEKCADGAPIQITFYPSPNEVEKVTLPLLK